MSKLFAVCALIAAAASANELSYKSLQSGPNGSTTPIFDHGIHGEGQIIAFLDTGVDYDSCFFVEANGSRPPINTRLDTNNVDLSRRKIVAYDFLYSCDQFPGAAGCDNPNSPDAWDNQGHGTHAAASAVGDRATPIVHDYGDSIAPGAKLIVQDAGYVGGDNCSERPGIGCPVNLTPILDQAYRQGARIHSNSWGDRQGVPFPLTPPTANYPQSARDVDAFVWSHPDMLIVFNTGNFSGTTGTAPASSLSAPGSAKNVLQVGGTRDGNHYVDDAVSSFTLVGPTRDGRIKPDLVGPAYVLAGDAKILFGGATCSHDVSARHVMGVALGRRRGSARSPVLHRWLLSERDAESIRSHDAERRAPESDADRIRSACPFHHSFRHAGAHEADAVERAGIRISCAC